MHILFFYPKTDICFVLFTSGITLRLPSLLCVYCWLFGCFLSQKLKKRFFNNSWLLSYCILLPRGRLWFKLYKTEMQLCNYDRNWLHGGSGENVTAAQPGQNHFAYFCPSTILPTLGGNVFLKITFLQFEHFSYTKAVKTVVTRNVFLGQKFIKMCFWFATGAP